MGSLLFDPAQARSRLLGHVFHWIRTSCLRLGTCSSTGHTLGTRSSLAYSACRGRHDHPRHTTYQYTSVPRLNVFEALDQVSTFFFCLRHAWHPRPDGTPGILTVGTCNGNAIGASGHNPLNGQCGRFSEKVVPYFRIRLTPEEERRCCSYVTSG